jgi:hypothetical protein
LWWTLFPADWCIPVIIFWRRPAKYLTVHFYITASETISNNIFFGEAFIFVTNT